MSDLELYKHIVQQQKQIEVMLRALEDIVVSMKEVIARVNALEENVRNEAIRHASEGSDF